MSEPIRILHVFGIMDRGGAETYIMNIYRQIDRSKIQFDFVVHSTKEGAFDQEITELGGKIYYVPAYGPKSVFVYKKAWNELLSNLPHKIIHAHVRSTASIFLKIAKKHDYTTIAHSHSVSSGAGFKGKVKEILQGNITKYSDYNIACSKEAGEWLFRDQPFQIVKNGIELEKYLFADEKRFSVRNSLGLDSKHFLVGHIGRFNSVKNHSFLIDIFAEMKRQNQQVKLLLVGDGVLRAEIEEKVRALGIEQDVIFSGVQSNVNECLFAMDCMVFPSIYEGLGISLIEAQATGLPTFFTKTLPEEVKITQVMNPISLEKNAEYWSNQITQKTSLYQDRFEQSIKAIAELRDSGYDIIEVSKYMSGFYASLEQRS